MSALDPLRARLAASRQERARARLKLEALFRDMTAAGDPEEKKALRERLESLRAEVAALRERETAGVMPELDPRQWMHGLDGSVPILLMPLRLQTRYTQSPNGRSLLVRVYPDDISAQAHDPTLTPVEADLGKQFWNAQETSEDETLPTRRSIWRGIAARYGLRRAAWIRQAADPSGSGPTVAETRTRIPAVWTLPERLVFRFYGPSDHLLAELPGNPIPDGLEVSFDPTREDLGFARDAGDFEYPPELAWQVDFDAAVKVGMGIAVPLDRIGNVQRIERLVAIGVRLADDEKTGAVAFERLIEDHRYTDGFSVVPQGTPTNVTQDSDARSGPDADAMLTWLESGGAYTDGGMKTRYDEECDGLRFAHALGLSPAAMQHVEQADCRDGSEAIAMKRALWSGTLGYYAQQMLWPLFESLPRVDPDRGERLMLAARFYFTHFVYGRGPLPAVRVGDQPYGVLPVSADMLKDTSDRVPPWNEAFIDGFADALHAKMLVLAGSWISAIPGLPRAGAGAQADTRLVDVLSLQASAAEYHGERLIGKEYLKEYVDFKAKGATTFADYEKLLDQRYANFAAAFPTLFATRPAIFDLSFFGGYWKQIVGGVLDLDRDLSPLLTGDVIDDLPYSESRTISDEYPNYLARIAADDFATVRRGYQHTRDGKAVPVTALLYMLARHSYLYEHAFSAMRLHRHFQGAAWRDFREKELYNTWFQLDRTYWDLLETEVPWPALGLGNGTSTVLKLVNGRRELRERFGDWLTFFGDVDQMYASLAKLGKLPTARLERLFAEHVDLCGYRLVAWVTGHTYQRLLAQRAWREDTRGNRIHPLYERPRDPPLLRYDLNHRPVDYAGGLYLGAYGWLEDIAADPASSPVTDLAEDLAPRNKKPVTRDADNYGLVHAPSLNQATTAALLRAASVSEPDTSAFNIDLSSRRVRDALWTIEGVRNGQTPAALLGYRFERGLRERDVKLLQYLPQLRDTFPMPKPVDTDPGAAEAIPARNVVNGLRLIQAYREGKFDAAIAPYVFAAADRSSMARIAAGIVDTLDACSDLMLAESVHQAAQGNFDRAGGVVTAAGEFTHVPDEFEVVQTPRSGTSLTHRVVIAMGAQAAVQEATPRARLEPQLNAWLGGIVGPLAQWTCALSYAYRDDGEAVTARYATTLDALALEPVDLLFIAGDENIGELGARLDRVLRSRFDADHPGTAIESIDVYTTVQGAPGTRPFVEMASLVAGLRKLLADARAMTQRDLLPPSVLHGRLPAAVDAFDSVELVARVTQFRADYIAAMTALSAAGDDAAIVDALVAAAAYGIPDALPAPGASRDALKAQVTRVLKTMQQRLDGADTKWKPGDALKAEPVRLLRVVIETLLAAGFPLMPRVNLTDDISAAALAPATLSAERVEDWLFTASLVRENAARLQHARMLASAAQHELDTLQVYQWPAAEKSWIAGPPPAGKRYSGDLVSIVVQPAPAFNPAARITGLVVDEWHEIIPNAQETTGVSFHYDAPSAEPPQALLLAVSQRRRTAHGMWSWDELVDCVDQALVLAKMRAVGPDELRHTPLDAVLPATLAAEASTPATIATSFLANISAKMAANISSLWTKT